MSEVHLSPSGEDPQLHEGKLGECDRCLAWFSAHRHDKTQEAEQMEKQSERVKAILSGEKKWSDA